MKLYTEEQVKDMLNTFIGERNVDDYLQRYYTPIELPSDDEIWDRADEIWGRAESGQSDVRHLAFMQSANWMRDKIQGGNNDKQ
jgi:hypothetical protein